MISMRGGSAETGRTVRPKSRYPVVPRRRDLSDGQRLLGQDRCTAGGAERSDPPWYPLFPDLARSIQQEGARIRQRARHKTRPKTNHGGKEIAMVEKTLRV